MHAAAIFRVFSLHEIRRTIIDTDVLYVLMQTVPPERITALRCAITAFKWHMMRETERGRFLGEWLPEAEFAEYYDLFSYFRFGGYRILGDLVCAIDDMYKAKYFFGTDHWDRKGDSFIRIFLITAYRLNGGEGDYKAILTKACRGLFKQIKINPNTVLMHLIALGERKFAFEVLLDRIEANAVK